jgi:anaerobic magnesium-protoporphyrin IX monomethyl ester cyclase
MFPHFENYGLRGSYRKGIMKSRVLLVVPSYSKEAATGSQPIGISYIASYLLNKWPELELKLIDYTVEKFSPELYQKELRDFKPEIVGISVRTLNFPGGKIVARLTKDINPDILTVMGGVHASVRDEECLEYCDMVVRGEGEVTFSEIVQDNELGTIRGISYRKDGRIVHNNAREQLKNLDDLPFPTHYMFEIDKYRSFLGWGVMGSRGCPYKCIFCCSPQTWGNTRYRSTQNIVDEIELLHDKFGIQRVTFFDDTLNIPQKRGMELCDEIIRRNLHRKMSFICQMRVNRQFVSPELFQKMKESNFVRVDFGIESGSEKVLKSIGKSLTPDEARKAIGMARKADIDRVVGYFMVGNWGETIWDVFKTWRFIFSANIEPAFSICTPFPGTEFYRRMEENGYIASEPDWANFNAATPIGRTDKMSKPSIFTVYVLSVLLQLGLSFVRGGRPLHTLSRMVAYVFDTINRRK